MSTKEVFSLQLQAKFQITLFPWKKAKLFYIYNKFGFGGHLVHYLQTLTMQAIIPIERHAKLTFNKFHALLALDKKPNDIEIVIFQAILKNLQHTFDQRKLQLFRIQCFKYIPHIPLIVIISKSVFNSLSNQLYRRLNCQSRTIGQHTHAQSNPSGPAMF